MPFRVLPNAMTLTCCFGVLVVCMWQLQRTAAEEECTLSLPPGIHRIPLMVGERERHFLAVVPSGPRVEGKLVPGLTLSIHRTVRC
eukprot:SAG31_NODE_2387_length_5809_cov_1.810683_2_plen_86_part_00